MYKRQPPSPRTSPDPPTHHYLEGGAKHPALVTAVVFATTGQHFSIGPWIIVPILILAAIIGTIVFVVRDRQKGPSRQSVR